MSIVNLSDVFISYSRRNTDFAKKLFDAFKAENLNAWADWEDIPKGAEWRKEIEAGILGANALLFIISPDSVASAECYKEIEIAVAAKKRIIPVLHVLLSREDESSMHPAISAHNWIFARESDDWDTAFAEILNTLKTDLLHSREHTRLLVRAHEWQESAQDKSRLLVGSEISHAETWLANALTKEPQPTEIHTTYIHASRAAAIQRQRQILAGVSVALVVSVFLLIAAVFLGIEANNNANLAATNESIAVTNADLAAQNAETAVANADLAATNESRALANANLAATNEARAVTNADLAAQNAETAVANANLAATNESRALANEERAIDNAATAVANANLAATNEFIAIANASTAVAAQQEAFINQQRALGLALAAQSSVAFITDEITALALAFNAAIIQPDLPLVQKSLSTTAYNARALQAKYLEGDFYPDMALKLPDNRFVTVNYAGFIAIWHIDQPEPITQWAGLVANPNTADVNAAGNLLAIGGWDGKITLIDLTNGEIATAWQSESSSINTIAISPDNTLLLTGGPDGYVYLWDIATQSYTWYLPSDSEPYHTAFSPDGKLAMIGFWDGTIGFWDMTNPETITTPQDYHPAWVDSVAFSPDGQWAASGSATSEIFIWDMRTLTKAFELKGHASAVNSLAFSQDNRWLLSGSRDRTMKLWDLQNQSFVHSYTGHNDWLLLTAFINNDTQALSAAYDDTAIVWDLSNQPGNLLANLPAAGNVSYVKFSADGQSAYVGYYYNAPVLIDLKTGRIQRRYTSSYDENIVFVTVSRNEALLAIGTETGQVIVQDTQTGQQVATFNVSENRINNLDFSADGSYLAVASGYDTLKVFEVAAQTERFNYHQEYGWLNAAALHPNGSSVYFTDFSGGILEYNFLTGEFVRIFTETSEYHTDAIDVMVFNQDGSRLLSGAADNRVILWDTASALPLHIMTGHTQQIKAVAFSPDESQILSGSNDSQVIQWDARFGEPVRDYQMHQLSIWSVAFSPDSKTILTGGDCVWNADNQCTQNLFLWRNDTTSELLAWVKSSRYVRELTCDERVLYSIEPYCES